MKQKKRRVSLDVPVETSMSKWVDSQNNINNSIKMLIQSIINQTGYNVDLFDYINKHYNIYTNHVYNDSPAPSKSDSKGSTTADVTKEIDNSVKVPKEENIQNKSNIDNKTSSEAKSESSEVVMPDGFSQYGLEDK